MKKIQLLGTVLMLSVVTTLLVACQKQQDGITNEVTTASADENVTAIQLNAGSIPGIISKDDAAAMAAAYNAEYAGKTQSVTFSIKDLQNFLAVLKAKGSKNISVNFGVYDSKTATSAGNVGKLTVFFTGDKKATSGNVRENAEEKPDEALNHGGIYP